MSPLQSCSQIASSHEVKSCQIMSNHMMIDMIWRELCNQIVSPATATYTNVNGQVRDSLHEERCRFVVKGEFHTSTTQQHFSSCKHPLTLALMQTLSHANQVDIHEWTGERLLTRGKVPMCCKRWIPHTRTHQHLPWTLALMQTLMQIKSSQSNQVNCMTQHEVEQSNQVKSNQIKSSQIKSNQIKSNQVKSSQIKSSQIKSSQINCVP